MDKTKIIKLVLETVKYAITAILGYIGGSAVL